MVEIKKKFDEGRLMFPEEEASLKLSIKDIIKNQLTMLHGDERIRQKFIPKVMDICLSKLYQLVDGGIYDPSEVLEGFILNDTVKDGYKHEDTLKKIKQAINKGKWDLINEYSRDPEIIAQLFLDFGESLSFQILTHKGIAEVDNTFKKSYSDYTENEGSEKKALHELFEDETKRNLPNKMVYYIVCKLISFGKVFQACDKLDLLVDRILVALMHKKKHLYDHGFIGRSMINSASEEDAEVETLSKVFHHFISSEEFYEFNMSPMPKRKLGMKHLHSYNNGSFTLSAMIPGSKANKKVQNFLECINQLDEDDQEMYLTKIEQITIEAKHHFNSVNNSPSVLPPISGRRLEMDSGNVAGELRIKLNKINGFNAIDAFDENSSVEGEVERR